MFFHEGSTTTSRCASTRSDPRACARSASTRRCSTTARTSIDPRALRGLGFAGFRVHYAINTPRYKDEVLVFLGASYFRALAKDQRYGISARGLAIDTGTDVRRGISALHRVLDRASGAVRATSCAIYALLDSPRAAGAYRFVLKPGVETVDGRPRGSSSAQTVAQARPRAAHQHVSTSARTRPGIDDYRPEVHDSDGLSIEAATGEWIWRPLVNPQAPARHLVRARRTRAASA